MPLRFEDTFSKCTGPRPQNPKGDDEDVTDLDKEATIEAIAMLLTLEPLCQQLGDPTRAFGVDLSDVRGQAFDKLEDVLQPAGSHAFATVLAAVAPVTPPVDMSFCSLHAGARCRRRHFSKGEHADANASGTSQAC